MPRVIPYLLQAAIAAFLPLLVLAQGAGENTAGFPRLAAVQPETAGSHVLGPADRVGIWVQQSDEITRDSYEVDPGGDVHLPMVGRLRAAGLTVRQFEEKLVVSLRRYFRDPQASVTLSMRNSQPVSVMGAVVRAGTYQLTGNHSLLEMITAAGGLRPDAGGFARVTRSLKAGRIPVPAAEDDAEGRFSVAEINLRSLMAREGAENIELLPFDTVTIPEAQTVYVIGEVGKQGGLPMQEGESMSVLQAISQAGGLSKSASPSEAKILRLVLGGPKRAELAVDVKRILAGKLNDQPLMPHDILFIPDSGSRKIAARIAEAGVQAGMSILTWSVVFR